jgi:hypothetical protein
MTLSPEQQELVDKYAIKDVSPSSPKQHHGLSADQQALVDKYEIKDAPPSSALGNFGRGALSSLTDAANFLVHPFTHPLGSHGPHVDIPQLQGGDPDSLSYGLGQLAAGIPVYGATDVGVAKLAGMAPKLIRRAVSSAPVRSLVSGALSGAALSAPGNRTTGAALGGILGPIGTGVGQLAGRGVRSLVQTPAYHKLFQGLSRELGESESPLTELGQHVAKNYKWLKGINDNNYEQVFGGLLNHKIGMEDLPKYMNAYNDAKNITLKGSSPEELEKEMGGRTYWGLSGTVKKGLNPHRINDLRSDILKEKRGAFATGNHAEAKEYSGLADALHEDLKNYLMKNAPEHYPYYREAQEFYKSHILPFDQHRGAQNIVKVLKETGNLKTPNGVEVLTKPGNELHASNFVSTDPYSDDTSKLESLGTLLQNSLGNPDKEKAAELTKNVLFRKDTLPNSESYDIEKYLSRYGKMKPNTRDALYDTEHQSMLDALGSYKKRMGKGGKLMKHLSKLGAGIAAGGALGAAVGPHLGAHELMSALMGMGGGAVGAYNIPHAALETAMKVLPDDPHKLIRYLQPYHSSVLSRNIVPGLAMGGIGINQGK